MAVTKKQVFNQVARHLIKQGTKCISDTDPSVCSIVNSAGHRCPLGVYLGDTVSKIDRRHYDLAIYDLGAQYTLKIPKSIFKLLTDLMDLHDDISPEFWDANLKDIAKDHRIDVKDLIEDGVLKND